MTNLQGNKLRPPIVKNLVVLGVFIFFPVLIWFLNVCMAHPNLAFLPGIFFLLSTPFVFMQHAPLRFLWGFITIVVGSIWVAYRFWENHMLRTLNPYDVPIRIDLVCFLPVLYSGTILATYAVFRSRRKSLSSSDTEQPKNKDGPPSESVGGQ